MKLNKSFPVFFIILFSVYGCSYNINSSIQKSEFMVSKADIKNSVLYLKPQVSIFRIDGYQKDDYNLLNKSENEIENNIYKLTKKFNILHQLQKSNILIDSSSTLNNLAQRIINTNEIQQNIFNQIYRKDERKLVQQLFTVEPSIGYDYCGLMTTLNTEWIGLIGVIGIDLKSKNKELVDKFDYTYSLPKSGYIQYHYIVNIVTGKIVYRDVRVFDDKINPEHLSISLYDTFFMLNKNLNP
jgi:hypothetical protein